jgi:signal peptidase I
MSASRAIRWARWGVVAAIVCIVAAIATRLALLDGWLRTVRIDGASMAPALCGAHLVVTCSDCGISFRCDAEHLPADGKLVCPNCGLREIDAGAFPVSAGDTVLVDRWPLVGRGPRRGDVVAYSDPIAGGLAAKRVAGLPGERLSIRGGDLYANGQIVRKSLAAFRQVAILVHDNDHLPQSLSDGGSHAFLRWKPQITDSAWEPIAGGYRWRPRQS